MNTEHKTLLNLGVKSNEDRTEYMKRYNTKIKCECGCIVKKLTYYCHVKTDKHKLLLELIELKKSIS